MRTMVSVLQARYQEELLASHSSPGSFMPAAPGRRPSLSGHSSGSAELCYSTGHSFYCFQTLTKEIFERFKRNFNLCYLENFSIPCPPNSPNSPPAEGRLEAGGQEEMGMNRREVTATT